MKIINIINNNRRKLIRYVLFSKKLKEIENKTVDITFFTKKERKAIEKYYEELEEFDGWDKFDITWDIGFGDDIIAQANRKNQWHLINKEKTEIILKPKDYWDKEADRLKISRQALLQKEADTRNITLQELQELYFNN